MQFRVIKYRSLRSSNYIFDRMVFGKTCTVFQHLGMMHCLCFYCIWLSVKQHFIKLKYFLIILAAILNTNTLIMQVVYKFKKETCDTVTRSLKKKAWSDKWKQDKFCGVQ
jgi:hypothetical protein